MVIILSVSPIKLDKIFKTVVLPEPVPPHTKIFSFDLTQASKKIAISRVIVPFLSKSSILFKSFLNLRIVKTGPFKDKGGIIALILDPSLSLASTIGRLESIVLPSGWTIFWIVLKIWSSFINDTLSSWTSFPSIST